MPTCRCVCYLFVGLYLYPDVKCFVYVEYSSYKYIWKSTREKLTGCEAQWIAQRKQTDDDRTGVRGGAKEQKADGTKEMN